ncbi:uncharacterized protein LOC120288600 [Eucalyptus grandis]|uniref:uncharacterized protein LOC120288600 n=1 Tax=Eucalyptus grandis TaxID=71139 RepID=UPI00192ED760|nr:uncharacterized protein LOC120288600 [Eucalyptus grandis]
MPVHIIAVIRPRSNNIVRRYTSQTSQSSEIAHSPGVSMRPLLLLGFDRLENQFPGVSPWTCHGVLRLLKPKPSFLPFDFSSPLAEISKASFLNQTLLPSSQPSLTKIALHGSSALSLPKLGLCSACSQPSPSKTVEGKQTPLLTGLQKLKPKIFFQRTGSLPPLLLCLTYCVLIC